MDKVLESKGTRLGCMGFREAKLTKVDSGSVAIGLDRRAPDCRGRRAKPQTTIRASGSSKQLQTNSRWSLILTKGISDHSLCFVELSQSKGNITFGASLEAAIFSPSPKRYQDHAS